ncbi:MAG: phosphoribosylanthranilate isomerase [bacterium]|nr:phosphoribosylanthranilate isomerase [bacterium]
MFRIKTCCIASLDEARLAIRHGATDLGLVAAMPSGVGTIPDERITEIARAIEPPTRRFLLTAETTAEGIAEAVERAGVDTVQIVDRLPAGTHAPLRERLPETTLVQVVHMRGEPDVEAAGEVAPLVDELLLDTGNPDARTKELGGTGRPHDWSLSAAVVASVDCPVYLAGGLRPDNVEAAIARVRPAGVDLCNGIRTDGRLDESKLVAFMAAVRRATSSIS